ncbi:unnamed protein product [Blepharisma stoltei]|uniref:SAP domain-containing protein n=1 Tax=Blepharisma stoltei TaxID=1481888 RepID=A0AAU9IHT4_9CILI|nr:unnamed protein product [Blepharisma stoltei]
MIIKRLFSIEKWKAFTVNQLRMELKSRNLPVYGLKDQLIERMMKYENNLNESSKSESTMENQSSQQEPSKSITRKRKIPSQSLIDDALNYNTQSFSIDLNKPKHLNGHPDPYSQKVLNIQKLNEEIDFKDIITYLEMTEENKIYDDKLWKLIDGLSDILQVSLYNLGILQSIDRNKFKEFLQKIPISSLDARRTIKIVRAILTINEVSYSLNEVEATSRSWTHAIVRHLINSINDLDMMDLAFMRYLGRDNFDYPQVVYDQISNAFVEKLINTSDFSHYTEQELLLLLKNLPPFEKSNRNLNSSISKILPLIHDKFKNGRFYDICIAVSNINNYRVPVPTQLMIEINRRQLDNWISKKATHFSLMMEVCFILHKNDFLSLSVLNEVIKAAENFIQNEGLLQKTVEFFYNLSQAKPYPPKLELEKFIAKFLELPHEQITVNCLMALAISSLQVDAGINDLSLNLINTLIKKLQESPISIDQRIGEQLLWKILELVKERPIFNYQVDSSLPPIKEEIKTVALELLKHLKDNPECKKLVYEYYLSMLTNTIPALDILTSSPTTFTVDIYAKLIWVYQAHLSPSMISKSIWMSLELLDKSSANPETIFYLSSVHSQLARSKKIDKTELRSLRNEILSLASSFKEYSFAIQYNLFEVPPQNMHKFITKTRYQNLYGEPLINTIIMLGKIGEYQTAARLTENLSYIQNKHPPIAKPVIKEFVNWLNKLVSHDLQYEPLSIFLANCLDDENPALVKIICQFIDKHAEEDDISEEFKEKLEKINANLSGESRGIESEEEIKEHMNLSAIDINYDTLTILETLISKRIFIKDLPQKFDKLLSDTTEKEELFEVIKKILDYLSVVGDNDRFVDKVYNKIDGLKLWSEAPQEVIASLLFLNLDKLDTLSHLIQKFLHAIYAGEPVESPVLNPKSNMFCFQPFLLKSVLEPRYVQSNFKPRFQTEGFEVLKVSKMTESHIAYNWKVHAILNALNESPTEESLQAVAYQYEKWDKRSSRKDFKYDFFRCLGESQKAKKELEGDKEDPITKWRADVILMKYKTVVLYAPDENMIYDENGQEVGTTYLIKVIQDQLEKIGGLRCITVKAKEWKEMDQFARKEYVKSLGIGTETK